MRAGFGRRRFVGPDEHVGPLVSKRGKPRQVAAGSRVHPHVIVEEPAEQSGVTGKQRAKVPLYHRAGHRDADLPLRPVAKGSAERPRGCVYALPCFVDDSDFQTSHSGPANHQCSSSCRGLQQLSRTTTVSSRKPALEPTDTRPSRSGLSVHGSDVITPT